MSASSAPSLPPRPLRSQKDPATGGSGGVNDAPQIPPRPARRPERSISPQRESFARSPLNETTFAINHGSKQHGGGLYASSQNVSSSSLPQRPPSVTLPSIGQEGNEYANVEEYESDADQSPNETRNVGSELKLHAPKPGLPTSSAKARIATVTRTDSSQAVAAGVGKILGDDKDPQSRPLSSKQSFTRHEGASIERLGSAGPEENEHGIPEIGVRVPMYPNAGDVQAPSPSPYASTPHAPGIGFHSDGMRPSRHHVRTKSGKDHFQGPPGSYGLHGHGIPVQDRLERAWYEKHPDALIREEGEYGPGIGGGRGEWALSGEDLNKLVRESARRESRSGQSTQENAPTDEQIGFLASEHYASRVHTPQQSSTPVHHKSHSNHSQTAVESPLKKTAFAAEELDKERLDRSLKEATLKRVQSASNNAFDSEAEDDVIHVDAPSRRGSRLERSQFGESTESLGVQEPQPESHAWQDEHGYSVPILASDEVAKSSTGEFMQPAISPHPEEHFDNHFTEGDLERFPSRASSHIRSGSHASSRPGSQPPSRPGSVAGGVPGLSRFTSHEDRDMTGTPLEDVEEYEPLFPEDEKKSNEKSSQGRLLTAADRLKRPDLTQHRFPSQDVWEDAPNSAQLMATVSTPEAPVEDDAETVTGDEVREHVSPPDQTEQSGVKRSHASLPAKGLFNKSYLREEVERPGMKQRFPSRDIWEDTPQSLQLQTTVGSSQMDEIKSPEESASSKSPPERFVKPPIPARPSKKSGVSPTEGNGELIPSRPLQRLHQVPPTDGPPVPARPAASRSPPKRDETSSTSPTKEPALTERPKPQVPARPIKAGAARDASREEAPGAPKPKPAVPARPAGGKLSGVKGGFLSDLEKRLQLGPKASKPAEKPAEEEPATLEEKQPLVDARKGRARGPVRRKPAITESKSAEDPGVKFEISSPSTIWQISDDGDVAVNCSSSSDDTPRQKSQTAPTPTLARNTAGEAIHEPHEISPATDAPSSPSKSLAADVEQGSNKSSLEVETNNTTEPENITSDDGDDAIRPSTAFSPPELSPTSPREKRGSIPGLEHEPVVRSKLNESFIAEGEESLNA